MKTREQMISEAKKYFKEHPEKLRMKDILFDLGITQIQKETILMCSRGELPYEMLKAYSDKRVAELKETLHMNDET